MKDAIDWVDVLLSRWGRWALRKQSGALGYATSSILAASGDGDGYDSAVPRGVVDLELDEVDAAVMKLPIVQIGCLVVVYQLGVGKSDRENAERAGVDHKTLARYVHDAQRKIALDMSLRFPQNQRQSVNGGNAPGRNEPVVARA